MTHPTSSDPDAFMYLGISKLRHHNVGFHHPKEVYTLACKRFICLRPLNMATSTMREALALATSDRGPLQAHIVQDIIGLSDVMRRWKTSTLTGNSNSKVYRSNSSTSNHSIDRSRPRRREEPSRGRGATKRASRRPTSDNDSAQPSPRKPSPRKDNHRQVQHRIYHERDEKDSPAFPPRIAH